MVNTSSEKKGVEKLDSVLLENSISDIIESNKKIWFVGSPILIDNFTDHGHNHSLRVLDNVNKLLNANNGDPLSEYELYVLHASIYLHDIGLQCDVIQYPEIKKIAEELGADFDICFNSPQSTDFSKEEQCSIRKNHGFLSAAWIDYAHKSGDTVLGPAVKNIPSNLVEDLMDVCKYHTLLSILDCKKEFNYSLDRKQYIAALLQLGDELDIDKNRITIETVKTYRIPSENAIFWWLHNRTQINFREYVIQLFVTLNEDDYKSFGSFINSTYITKFLKKNYPATIVLAENKNPIILSIIPGIKINKRDEPFPKEIKSFIQTEMTNNEYSGKYEPINMENQKFFSSVK
jgi:hypothetical protein